MGSDKIFIESEKTYGEYQRELYEQLKAAEYMNEVAMPGVQRPVNPEDTKR